MLQECIHINSYTSKNEKKNKFLCCRSASTERILKIRKGKESDPELDPDPVVRGTDPGIRIRIRTQNVMDLQHCQ